MNKTFSGTQGTLRFNNNPIQSQRSLDRLQTVPSSFLSLFFSFCVHILAKIEVFRIGFWAQSAKKIKLHHLILVGFFPLVMVSATASAKIAYGYEKFKRFYIMDFIKLVLQILVILVSCQDTCLTLKGGRCSYLKKLTEFLNTGFQVTLIMEQTNILISNLNAGQQKYLQCRHFLLSWPECHGICSHEEFFFHAFD